MKIYIGFAIAAILWFVMFSPLTAPSINFWYVMCSSGALLTAYSLYFGKQDLKIIYHFEVRWIGIGLLAAVFLYGLFFLETIYQNLCLTLPANKLEAFTVSALKAREHL